MCVEGIDGMVWLSWFVRFIETFCQQVWGAACTAEVKSSTDEVLSAGNGKSGAQVAQVFDPEEDCDDSSGSLK